MLNKPKIKIRKAGYLSMSTNGRAGENEKRFKEWFESKYGKGVLKGKCKYNDGNKVSISVDNSIEFGDKKILIEIDSANMAKLLVGEYVLLNELLSEEDKEKVVLFLVIHYYKDYKPERTIKNLKLINENIYKKKGIKFKVFDESGFEKFCKKNTGIESLVKELYK